MMKMIDFNLIKLVFGVMVTVGFFVVLIMLFLFPTVTNDLVIFMLGQASVAFILVYRHIFQAKPRSA